jgi:hypothetical protein
MLARLLTTILPAMPLALETTRMHRVAGLTGARTAVVATRPFRAPHHTISDVGLIGVVWCRGRATCRWRTTGCSCSMNGRNSAATSWRYCANPSRRVFSEYNLQSLLNPNAFATLALKLLTASGAG